MNLSIERKVSSVGVEFELKYTAGPAQQEAIRQQYLKEHRQYQMETTYYDTPSGALSQRRFTLRRRMENGEAVCTVKTPISGYGRGEWDCRCESIHDSLSLLCQAGAPGELPELASEGLQSVCGARFTRLAGDVTLDAAVVELALDWGVLMGGGRELELCEVEVELKSGDPDAAVAFGMLLQARYGLIPQEKSKFRRALDLAKGG